MGSHAKGSPNCWCGQSHVDWQPRCLKRVPDCNCDGSPLTIGGPMPDRCDHDH